MDEGSSVSTSLILSVLVFFFVRFAFIFERVKVGEGQREGGQRIQSRLHADSSEPDAGKLLNREILT